MKIALISCTSEKQAYRCPAWELYSASPRLQLAFDFAKRVADQIFILSAKYGLVPEHMTIEPYDETLNTKSATERRTWADKVLHALRAVADLQKDEFIVLAGKVYYENLVPHLKCFWLPLKNKRLGEWIPELHNLIALETEKDVVRILHMLFNSLPRLEWTMINQIPFRNGIYVMFEEGERFHGMDRIVRVGTHRGQGRLLMRLADHFVKEDADGSIFRKNIGRAFLSMASDPYLQLWDIDMHLSENQKEYGHLVDKRFEAELEARITKYLRENITFVCFPVENEDERLRLEEGIIATLAQHPEFGPSPHWLGLNSPVPEIARSGLRNRQGLNGRPLTSKELERIKWLARFGNDSSTVRVENRVNLFQTREGTPKAGKTVGRGKVTSNDIRQYIDALLQDARMSGQEYIDLTAGEIHKQMVLRNRHPDVCRLMYEKMTPYDKILRTTPSGYSSTVTIRYYLKHR